jgi:hypothetical protein
VPIIAPDIHSVQISTSWVHSGGQGFAGTYSEDNLLDFRRQVVHFEHSDVGLTKGMLDFSFKQADHEDVVVLQE